MPVTTEHLHQGSSIYFYLLKHKIVEKKQDILHSYFTEPEVQETVRIMAKQSGTIVLESPTKLHLVVEPEGSIYASSFSHLKEKHTRVKSIPDLYVIHLLLMVLLSEIDGDLMIRNEREISGIGFFKWVELMDQTFTKWTKDLEERPELENEWGIAITRIMDLWFSKHVYEDSTKTQSSTKTKFSYCMLAAKLLEEEKLVRLYDDREQTIIYPTEELYERLDLLFHDQERFKQIKAILDAGRNNHAHD